MIKNSLGKIYLCIIIFLFNSCGLIGAGTHGSVKEYEFNFTKSEVNKAIKNVLETSPEYKIPNNYYSYTWHYGGDSTINDEWIQQANADSVSFSFYFPHEDIIIWCAFVGHADNWYKQNCILSLIGYINPPKGKWKFESEMNAHEKQKITSEFEHLILNRLSEELKTNR